jgi:hypothetical protein
MSWLWWGFLVYLLGLPLGAWLAGGAIDTGRASRWQLYGLGALIWPVLAGYMLAGLTLMLWERWRAL